jgi:hypothetical protein
MPSSAAALVELGAENSRLPVSEYRGAVKSSQALMRHMVRQRAPRRCAVACAAAHVTRRHRVFSCCARRHPVFDRTHLLHAYQGSGWRQRPPRKGPFKLKGEGRTDVTGRFRAPSRSF